MIDQNLLTEVSRWALSRNIRLLQGTRLAYTDEEHVGELLAFMAPEAASYWLDVGSGFGEPARLMRKIRPDLSFTLLNNNQFQIDNTPRGFVPVHGDMHALPFDDATFDGAMFLYSICHADDLMTALKQAARVTRIGGALFVFDYIRTGGDNDLAQEHLSSQFYGGLWWGAALAQTGWTDVVYACPDASDMLMRNLMNDDALYDKIFNDLRLVLIRAKRHDP